MWHFWMLDLCLLDYGFGISGFKCSRCGMSGFGVLWIWGCMHFPISGLWISECLDVHIWDLKEYWNAGLLDFWNLGFQENQGEGVRGNIWGNLAQ